MRHVFIIYISPVWDCGISEEKEKYKRIMFDQERENNYSCSTLNTNNNKSR